MGMLLIFSVVKCVSLSSNKLGATSHHNIYILESDSYPVTG